MKRNLQVVRDIPFGKHTLTLPAHKLAKPRRRASDEQGQEWLARLREREGL